jgi:selenocysteine-specific elongation factor
MHVVATAGHVDHGKSTLVRALTGMEPDRWAEERRRGMTIDLGFAWTVLPDGTEVAFVDVPGHERFVPNMLAGVGPAPAVLFVVAADDGWRPQSAEHLAALDALGVRDGLLAVTRADLADPAPAAAEALERLAGSSLRSVEAVAVSATTGAGLDALRAALSRLLARLPAADPEARLRLWVDRSFTVKGAGTVVTGTLGAGRLRVGDEVVLAPAGRPARVRGLQSLGRPGEQVDAVARVAVNLRGVPADAVQRGDAVVRAGEWLVTDRADVALHGEAALRESADLVLHLGSAAVPARLRPFPGGTARLALRRPLPMAIGDVGLVRDPSRHDVLLGLTVLDPLPPPLRRRGEGRRRAEALAQAAATPPRAEDEVRRRGLVTRATLRRLGVPDPDLPPLAGDWVVDPARRDELEHRLHRLVADHQAGDPLGHGVTVEAARAALDLPDVALVRALVTPPLALRGSRVVLAERTGELPAAVGAAVAAVAAELADRPFAAPDAERLQLLGLGARELAAAERAGRLLRVAEGLVLLPDAPRRAAGALAALPQPFTVSAARAAWSTTRRVAVPLLELLDRQGVTQRLPDGTRRLRGH